MVRSRIVFAAALAAVGCATDPAGEKPGDAGTTGGPPETTGVGGAVLSAACAETDNPLRFDCSASLSTPTALTWTVWDGDAAVRTFETTATAEPALTVWGLAPDTDYVWEATGDGAHASGTVHTGPLPAGLASVAVTTTGAAEDVDAFVVPFDCDGDSGIAMFGADGRVRWYAAFDFGPAVGVAPALAGFDWTGDGVLAVLQEGRVVALGADGTPRFDVSGFERPIHHDATVAGDHVYVLNAADHDGYVVDGLYVLDLDGNLVADWDLADHVPVQGEAAAADPFWSAVFPGAIDWSHANGISADGDDHLLVSLRMQSAVARISADPDAADFGDIDWMLTGNADGDLAGDFAWPDGGGFVGQHHASRRPDGGLAVFDNGPAGSESRALFLDVDEGALTAREAADWSVGQWCFIEGGAYALPGGGALATCDTGSTVYEFAPGSAEPVWTASIECPSAGFGFGGLIRARPADLR